MKPLFFSVCHMFLSRVWGCINAPYQTYREMSRSSTIPFDVLIVWICVTLYSLWAPVVRSGVSQPYLLTVQSQVLLASILAGYLLMVLVLWYVGNWVGGKGDIWHVMLLWTYTLLPTLLWFFLTSLLYIVLPPPRTVSILGKIFSIVFLIYSLGLLSWKIMLTYLTLRFGFLLDMKRILISGSVVCIVLVLYAVWLYHVGVSRIPFI